MSNPQVNLAELRERALKAIEQNHTGFADLPGGNSSFDQQHLVEELRVYQTELEIQNQQLISAQSEISLALEKYRSLFAYLPLPALIVDAQGFILDANLQATGFFGLSQNAALQRRSATQLFEFESRAAFHELLRDRTNETAQTLPLLGLRVGGETIVCDVHVIHLFEEAVPNPRTILLFVDQSAKMALRESEHNLRSLADSTTGLIWAADTEKLYYYFNKGWLKFTGRTLDEEQGNGWMQGVHGDDLERCIAIYELNFDVRKAFSMDYRLRRHDGEFRWIRDNGTPRYNTEGQFVGFLGHCLDITDRVEAEQSLRKLSQAVEQSPESILITNRNAEIEYVNAAFGLKTGYSREEVIGKNPRILQSGKTPAETYTALWSSLGKGQIWKGELYNRRKDGREYIEFASITPLRQMDGAISHYVAVQEDITEKKRLSIELEQHRHHLEVIVEQRTRELVAARNQAEAANIAKSAFLANMSHEIRTPMNGIIGMVYLLRRNGVTMAQAEKLDKIETAGQHLMSVINDILDISKIEAGKLVLEETPVHIEALVSNVRSMLFNLSLAKGLVLAVEIQPLPPHLLGDPMRIQQALLNYATNAVKFTDTGSITLRIRCEEETPSSALLHFAVQDSGNGIDPATQARLFSTFEQGDNSTTRKFGGTGLGLVITRRLAELMGGNAGFESITGQGSTFWFTTRLQKASEPAKSSFSVSRKGSAEEVLKRDFSRRRILLVEDEPVNREIALFMLEDIGLQIDTADDGNMAVEMAARTDYALILMDMQLPTMDGVSATHLIRASEAGRQVPIVAMTANAFTEDRKRCMDAGMSDFISKPFEPDGLFSIILKWLQRESR